MGSIQEIAGTFLETIVGFVETGSTGAGDIFDTVTGSIGNIIEN